MPPPTMTVGPLIRRGYPRRKDPRLEDQGAFSLHVSAAGDQGLDLAVRQSAVGRRESAPDDALLLPGRTFGEFAVGGQAGDLGAGPGPTGRTIVSLTGAKHEVAAIGGRGGGEELDMVDLPALGARDALRRQRLPNLPSKRGERLDLVEGDATVEKFDQENQLPPQAMSPWTKPWPGTSSPTCLAWR